MNEKEPTISVVLMTSEGKHDVKEFFHTIKDVADELVVVITGLVNGAPLIEECAASAAFPVRIFFYHQPKFHDGATRAYATEQCRMDYVLQLDSDERLSEGFIKNVRRFLREQKPLVVSMPRVDDLVPHFIDIMDGRLFKRDGGAYYTTRSEDAVHPHLSYTGKPVHFNEPVLHFQGNSHWLRRPQRIFGQLAREIEEVPNTRGFWRELYRGVLGFYYKFKKTYFQQQARKDGRAGLRFAILKGLYAFLKCLFIGLKPRVEKENSSVR